MSKRSFLLAAIIMLGLFLTSCGSPKSGEVALTTEASSPETTSNSTSPSTTAQSTSTKEPTTAESASETTAASTPSPSASSMSVESVDWRNTRYTTDCQSIAPQPFTVDVKNGQGQGPPDSKYSHGYGIQVEDVATGDLTGDGKPEAAVELFCGATDTDISFSYVQVYTDGPSGVQMLAQLKPPDQTNCSWPPPRFNNDPFLIRSGQLVIGADYLNCPLGSPPTHPVFTWKWDGSKFTAQQEGGSSAGFGRTTAEKTTSSQTEQTRQAQAQPDRETLTRFLRGTDAFYYGISLGKADLEASLCDEAGRSLLNKLYGNNELQKQLGTNLLRTDNPQLTAYDGTHATVQIGIGAMDKQGTLVKPIVRKNVEWVRQSDGQWLIHSFDPAYS